MDILTAQLNTSVFLRLAVTTPAAWRIADLLYFIDSFRKVVKADAETVLRMQGKRNLQTIAAQHH